MSVGAGAILEDVEDALVRSGLLLGHDPWSRPIATVGGAISTNGMGYLAGKYGSMGEQVLGLQVVLGNGDVIETPGVPKVAGPDVDSLFVGAEGAMGHHHARDADRPPTAGGAAPVRLPLQRLHGGLQRGAGDARHRAAAGDDRLRRGVPQGRARPTGQSETTLYLSFEGYREEAAAQRERGHRICTASGGELLPAEEVEEFWRGRHSSAERYKREVLAHGHAARRRRRAWRMDYLHVAIPSSKVPEYHDYCQRLLVQRASPFESGRCGGGPSIFRC